MATTAFQPGGYPGRPYGSFAGKASGVGAGPHNPGRITTLWPYGGPGHLYGTFTGKQASDEPVVDTPIKTGTGGIDPGDAPRRIYKPTGLLDRPKTEARKDVEDRVEESRELHAEIAGELARELRGEIDAPETTYTLSEVDLEIGRLLKKVQLSQDEELLLLILMAVA